MGCALVLASVGACGGDAAVKSEGVVVATVAGQALYQSQVEVVAQREGLDEAAAKQRAIETLQLAAARREELGDAAALAPERAAHLRDAALARAYLKGVFEAEHGPEQVSDKFLLANLSHPQGAARWFHPKLHACCQIIVMPKQPTEPDATAVLAPGPEDPWWEGARAFLAPIEARLRKWEGDLEGEQTCDLIQTAIANGKQASEDGEAIIKVEQGMYHVDLPDTWSEKWVAAMTKVDEPGFVGPFETEYGIHFVYVMRVMEDTSVVPVGTDNEERIAKQSEVFRTKGLDQWRATEALPNHLRDLRERFLVRVAGAGTGSVIGQPSPD